jgi:hypothetical protein
VNAEPQPEGLDPAVERDFEEFWRDIVTTGDGALDVDQVKRELYDYHRLMRDASRVYYEATGGQVSKPNTRPDAVIAIVAERMAPMDEVADELTVLDDYMPAVEARVAELDARIDEILTGLRQLRDSLPVPLPA